MAKRIESVDYMRSLIDYNPGTGELTWKVNRFSVRPGSRAGTVTMDGRIRVHIDRVNYPAGRLAWFLYYGEWPAGLIDHIDRDPCNNAIQNLRLATHTQNMRNRTLNKNSKTGVAGVSWIQSDKTFRATIQVDGRTVSLGRSKDFQTAVALRKAGEAKHFQDFQPR